MTVSFVLRTLDVASRYGRVNYITHVVTTDRITDLDFLVPCAFEAELITETLFVNGEPIAIGSQLAFACRDCGASWISVERNVNDADRALMKVTAATHAIRCPAFPLPMFLFTPSGGVVYMVTEKPVV